MFHRERDWQEPEDVDPDGQDEKVLPQDSEKLPGLAGEGARGNGERRASIVQLRGVRDERRDEFSALVSQSVIIASKSAIRIAQVQETLKLHLLPQFITFELISK